MSPQPKQHHSAVPGPDFDEFLECWRAMPRRAHPFLPCRKDCTPARLGAFLPQIGIAEFKKPGQLDVLFYGSELERASGLKITGMNYYDLLPNEFRGPMLKFHEYIFGVPCGAYIADFVRTEAGNQYLYESVQFPLADEDGTVRFILVHGRGRKPFTDTTDRMVTGMGRRAIKEMHYLDLGAGAPTARIENFIFYR